MKRWLLLLCALPYLANLTGPFFYDDIHTVRDNAFVTRAQPLLHYLSKPSELSGTTYNVYRPLTILSYRLNWLMGGGATWPFHLTNLLLHLLCGYLVFWLAQRLYKNNFWLGMGAAALFLLHPGQAQVVNYIADRAVLLATVMMLAASCSFVAQRLWLCLGCTFLALLSKEVAITTPLFLGLILLWPAQRGTPLRRWALLGVSLLCLAYLGMRQLVFHSFQVTQETVLQQVFLSRGAYLRTQLMIVMGYLGKWWSGSFYYVINDAQPLIRLCQPQALLTLAVLLAGTLWVVISRRRQQYGLHLAWYAGWYGSGVVLTSSLFPLYVLANPNRPYLANVACCLLAAQLGAWLWQRYKTKKQRTCWLSGATLLLLALATSTFNQSLLWSDDLMLLDAMVQRAPHSPAAVYYYGKILADRGYRKEAAALLKTKIAEVPRSSLSAYPRDGYQYYAQWYELFALNSADGNATAALSAMDQAVAIWPQQARLWFNLMVLHENAGDLKQARQALAQAEQNLDSSATPQLLKAMDEAKKRLREK